MLIFLFYAFADDQKGNANWIFNTIIDSMAAETVFIHGNLSEARDFVHELPAEKTRFVSQVFTLYGEKGLTFKVQRRGRGLASEPSSCNYAGALKKDVAQNIQHTQNEIKRLKQEAMQKRNQHGQLDKEIRLYEQQENQYIRKKQHFNSQMDKLNETLDQLRQRKANLEESMNMDATDERQLTLQQYADEISEFDAAIQQIETDMQPGRGKLDEIKLEMAKIKKKREEISNSIQLRRINQTSMEGQRNQICQEIENLEATAEKNRRNEKALLQLKRKMTKELEPVEAKSEELFNKAVELSNGVREEPPMDKKDTQSGLRSEIEELENGFQEWSERSNKDRIELRYNEMKPKFEDHQTLVNRAATHIDSMKRALGDRYKQYRDMQSSVKTRLKLRFAQTMLMQGHKGDLDIDYENQSLEMRVKLKGHDSFQNPLAQDNSNGNGKNKRSRRVTRSTRFSAAAEKAKEKNRRNRKRNGNSNDNDNNDDDDDDDEDMAVIDDERNSRVVTQHEDLNQHGVTNTKTLSGGERSFTQIAFILALQQFSGSPFCIYDEFDVFMDSVNRGNSIRILIDTATKAKTNRQYVFITPHDVSPMMKHGDENIMRIHKLNPPRDMNGSIANGNANDSD